MKAKKKSEANMQKSWMMSALDRLSGQSPDHPLVVQGKQIQTRAQMLAAVKSIAGFLQSLGIKRGMRVIFDIDTSLSWRVLASWCACQCIGAISFFWPVDMRFRHESEEMNISDEINGMPSLVLISTPKRAAQWKETDLKNHVEGRTLIDLTGACSEMSDVIAWDEVLNHEAIAPQICPDNATIVYTQGSHQFERSVYLSLLHLRNEAEDLQNLFQLDMHSRLWADLNTPNTVNLILFAACLQSGATLVCHDQSHSLDSIRDESVTHAFLLPGTLSKWMHQIKIPEGYSGISRKWRELSLKFSRLRAKQKTIFAGAIQKACIQPIINTHFPALKAVISYGNHFDADVGNFFSYLDIPIYNAFTMSELGFVHIHAFMGTGGFLKCMDARIKMGILAVKSKREGPFIDSEDLVFEDERCGLCSKRAYVITLQNGAQVDVSPMREILRRDPLIDEIFVFGEGKPYLTGLVYLNEQALTNWANGAKQKGSFAELAKDAQLYKHIRDIVDRCNMRRAPHESIQKIAILTCPLDRDPRILTPCGLTRRVDVERRYAKILDAFYRENF